MLFRVILACIFIAAVGMLAIPVDDFPPLHLNHEKLDDIRTGLAEALIIAVVLATTVDLYVKTRLAEEIARDVSIHMASAYLPKTLRDEIREICNTNLYRSLLTIEYKIVKTENPNKIRLTNTCSFSITNVAGTAKEFTHAVTVQRPFGAAADLQLINYVRGKNVRDRKGIAADYDETAKPNTDGLGVDHESKTHRAWSKSVWIAGNETADFAFETTQILPDEHAEPFISIHPVTRTIISVDYPSDTAVTITFGHRSRESVDEYPKARPTTWIFGQAMMPFQPIIVEWRKPARALSEANQAGILTGTEAESAEPSAESDMTRRLAKGDSPNGENKH